MGIENNIISMVKEVVLFNSFESLFVLSFILIYNQIKINKKTFLFHIFMLSVSNYVFSNVMPYPGVMQLIYIVLLVFYFRFIFRLKIISSLLPVLKSFGWMFIIETLSVIIYKFSIGIDITSLSNDYLKFFYMLAIRCIEISFIIYILHRKRGENYYEKNNQSYCKQ